MLQPQPQPTLGGVRLLWLTDLMVPRREALGLTSSLLSCDRLAHRYRVDVTDAVPWHDWKLGVSHAAIARLELPDTMPSAWFVLTHSALAILDRAYDAAREWTAP